MKILDEASTCRGVSACIVSMMILDRFDIQVAQWRRVINDCLDMPSTSVGVAGGMTEFHRVVQKPRCDGSLGG